MNIEQYTIDDISNALKKANGFISVASKNLNCDSKTIYNYLNKYPELKELLTEIRSNTLDYAESKLLQHIDKDNFNALKFFLETQGKNRGYSVRTENLIVERTTFDDLPSLDKL